jgi:acetylornithine deacetylase/succinyl-diaminopimelate desuccinylase-like protein
MLSQVTLNQNQFFFALFSIYKVKQLKYRKYKVTIYFLFVASEESVGMEGMALYFHAKEDCPPSPAALRCRLLLKSPAS